MITLSKNNNAIRFTFEDSQHYLYKDGTIDVPVNSLSLVIDESDMVTFRKAASNDIFVSAPIAAFGMSKADLKSWYEANMVGSTGGGSVDPSDLSGLVATAVYVSSSSTIDFKNLDGNVISTINAEPFITDGMVDSVEITGGNLVITFNVDAGKQPISIPLSDIFDPSNYYDKTATNALLAGKLDASAYTPTDLSEYYTSSQTNAAINEAVSGKVDVSELEEVELAVAQSISVLDDTKQNALQYITEDTEGGFVDVNIDLGTQYYGATMGGGAITFITSNLNDESNTGNTLEETQIDVQNGSINIIGTIKNYDAVNQEWVEESGVHELQSKEDGLYVDSEKIATVPMLNDKADVSAVTAAVSAVTPCVFDFGRAATLGVTDDDWNMVMDAYQNNKPVIGILGTLRYACESLVLNTDADDHQVFQFTVSDGTSRYILDVTNLGNSQYQITRYDTIVLPTTNDITNWNAKQDTLVAGSGIAINGNVISATGGGGGGNASITSVTQAQYEQISGSADPSTLYVISDAPAVDISNYYTKTEVDDLLLNVDIDVDTAITQGSTNAVEGGAIYDALQGKANTGDVVTNISANYSTLGNITNKNFVYQKGGGGYTLGYFIKINGVDVLNDNHADLQVVGQSAITTSMTSSSTDSQVPSAKAVYDAMGGLTLLPISQADYDLLPTKDPNTLYIITNVVNNS